MLVSQRQRKIMRWKVASSVADFVAAAACALAIVFLFTVIMNLYGWLRLDIQEALRGVTQNITGAIIMGE